MRQEEPFQLIEGMLTNGSPISLIVFLSEVEEGVDNCGIVGDELMIEVGKAKERLDVLDFGEGRPGGDTVKLDRVHGELSGLYDHSEIFYFRNVKLAFFKLQVKVKFSHPLEDMAGLLSMGFWVEGGNEEVVHVDNKLSLNDHVSEGVVHKLLEYGGGVAETEEHDSGFEKSLVDDEGSLPLVAVLDLNIVVLPVNIELGKVVNIFQLVHKVGDEREEVGIMGGMFIEVVIVLARVEFAILLFDEEEGGGLRRVGRANLSSS